MRFWGLGSIPAGLNSDEASIGVEALSILTTGMDRWGYHYPIWFPAWGSGMNALYTYLAVPVVRLFGLHVTSLRAIGAVFGLLTLPVTYHAARIHFGRDTAIVTMGLVALLPWHVMSSRWALDSNLNPLLFTLGIYTIGKALTARAYWPVVAFLPWAVGAYAYPLELIPAVASGIVILIAFRRQIAADPARWGLGIGLALLVALPFLLFLLKNQLGIVYLPLEGHLPFSVPTLPASRFSQIHLSFAATVLNNLTFLLGGYRDAAVWHESAYFLPLTAAAPYLTLLGTLSLGWSCWKTRQINIVLVIVLTCVISVILIPLNLNRLNWFYIPSLMIACRFVLDLGSTRKSVLAGSAVYLALFLGLFYPYYFFRYNQEILIEDVSLGNGFRVGLEQPLRTATAEAKPGETVFVDVGTVHPYLYVLFYGLSDLPRFQTTRQLHIVDGVYRVAGFDRFAFEPAALKPGVGFTFVSRSNHLPCAEPETFSAGPLWTAGRCKTQHG